jgi:hypothetical protein
MIMFEWNTPEGHSGQFCVHLCVMYPLDGAHLIANILSSLYGTSSIQKPLWFEVICMGRGGNHSSRESSMSAKSIYQPLEVKERPERRHSIEEQPGPVFLFTGIFQAD